MFICYLGSDVCEGDWVGGFRFIRWQVDHPDGHFKHARDNLQRSNGRKGGWALKTFISVLYLCLTWTALIDVSKVSTLLSFASDKQTLHCIVTVAGL